MLSLVKFTEFLRHPLHHHVTIPPNAERSTTSTHHLIENSHKTSEYELRKTAKVKQTAGRHGVLVIPLASLYNGNFKHGSAAENFEHTTDNMYTTDTISHKSAGIPCILP